MSFLRLRPFSSLNHTLQSRTLSTTSPRLFATQGYGDGKGDPKGSDPQNQPASNKTQHDGEHPGPPPPEAGKGTGGGPTKASGGAKPEDASAESGGSRSKEATETGESPTGGKIGGKGESGDGARPMIHDESVPDAGNKKSDVERHNSEFKKGHDRAQPAEDDRDKVDKKFWKGHGGADRNP